MAENDFTVKVTADIVLPLITIFSQVKQCKEALYWLKSIHPLLPLNHDAIINLEHDSKYFLV